MFSLPPPSREIVKPPERKIIRPPCRSPQWLMGVRSAFTSSLRSSPRFYVANPSLAISGLDYDGNPTTLRMVYWDQSTVGSGNIFEPYPATVLMKIYTRSALTITGRDVGGGVQARYGTYFFWGNNGDGLWASTPPGTANNSYWGIEPYPRPAPSGETKLEIATWNQDFTDRNNSGAPGDGPYVADGEWISVALVAKYDATGGANHDGINENSGRLQTIHDAWMRLPSTSSAHRITTTPYYTQPSGTIVWWDEPPNRGFFIGQSPPSPTVPSNSWGGYPKWDECNAILRGIQVYKTALTEAQILTMQAFEYDASVLGALAGQGISGSDLWFLSMNPKPTDVTDKSGNGHHGTFNHASYRPALWSG